MLDDLAVGVEAEDIDTRGFKKPAALLCAVISQLSLAGRRSLTATQRFRESGEESSWSFQNTRLNPCAIDARSDLYALGVTPGCSVMNVEEAMMYTWRR